MFHAPEHGGRISNDLVRGNPLDIGDKPDTTAIVLEKGIVKTAGVRVPVLIVNHFVIRPVSILFLGNRYVGDGIAVWFSGLNSQ